MLPFKNVKDLHCKYTTTDLICLNSAAFGTVSFKLFWFGQFGDLAHTALCLQTFSDPLSLSLPQV